MSAVHRMIDANANRAREALRVLEDVARFALDDAPLSAGLKTLRHDLRAALGRLPAGRPEASRDTPGDVGTSIATGSEGARAGLDGVAVAAGKRLGESLRVLEESAKVIDPGVAAAVEAIRYRAYDLESRLLARLGAGRRRQWALCVLLTESRCRRPWDEVLRHALAGGADCLQVREKGEPDRRLLGRVRDAVTLARPAGVSVIVNDRADIALAAGADGVHVGRDDLTVDAVRRLAGRELMVGVSTHDAAEAAAAVEAGADYCGVGSMFDTSMKPDLAPAGPALLAAFLAVHPRIPHLAIGGIDEGNVHEVVAAGARGVAVCSAVCGAEEPVAVVRRLRAAVDDAARPCAVGRSEAGEPAGG